jgi:putative ABC transport system substrate-binding protein
LERANDTAARASGLTPQWLRVKGPKPDLDAAFAAMRSERAEVLLVLEVPVTVLNFKSIAELAAEQRMPTMFPGGWENQGLITFGTSINDAVPRVAAYVDRILKGDKPAEMPVEVVARQELVINLKTPKAIGVTIPPELLKRATRVIQ